MPTHVLPPPSPCSRDPGLLLLSVCVLLRHLSGGGLQEHPGCSFRGLPVPSLGQEASPEPQPELEVLPASLPRAPAAERARPRHPWSRLPHVQPDRSCRDTGHCSWRVCPDPQQKSPYTTRAVPRREEPYLAKPHPTFLGNNVCTVLRVWYPTTKILLIVTPQRAKGRMLVYSTSMGSFPKQSKCSLYSLKEEPQ